jgi:hypothetical protein
MALGTLLVASVVPLSPHAAAAAPRPSVTSSCVDGLTDVTSIPAGGILSSMVRHPDGRTIGVGLRRLEGEGNDVQMLTAIHEPESGWTFSFDYAQSGDRAQLNRVTVAPTGEIWAVGNRFHGLQRPWPMVLHRVGNHWVETGPTTGEGFATGVAVDARNTVWVTTVDRTPTGKTASLYRRKDGVWKRIPVPAIPGVERYAAVAAPTLSKTFIVGSIVSSKGVRPFVLARTGTKWVRESLVVGVANARLTQVQRHPDGSMWATGWAVHPGKTRPLALRRDGDGVWRNVTIAGQTALAGLVIAATDGSGHAAGVGASYLATAGQYLPTVLTDDGGLAWSALPRAGWFAAAAAGDPTDDGWVEVVRTRKFGAGVSVLGRICETAPITDPGLRAQALALSRKQVALVRQRAERRADRERATRLRYPSERALRRAAGPAGVITGPLAFQDIGTAIGLPVSSTSYGIGAGDVDGDGRKDIIWSAHGAPIAIFLRDDGGYTRYTGPGFALADRHACVVAPLDSDAKDDIACVTGGMSGQGITTNELYLDPVSGSTTDTGTQAGLTDPIMRGRALLAFDADGDGDRDLFQAGDERGDGVPTLTRLLINDGTAEFSWSVNSGLTSSDEFSALTVGDTDLDGLSDLLVHVGGARAPDKAIRLYRNEGGTFRDVAASVGLFTIGDVDLAIAELNGKGWPEILQLSPTRLRIGRYSLGWYVRNKEFAVTDGARVATGDIDGDGDLDIYVAQGVPARPQPDVVFRNKGDGKWTRFTVPGTEAGTPDDILVMDVDDDGRDEFVIVTGKDGSGPIQVVDAVPALP